MLADAKPKWPTACMWYDKPRPSLLYGEVIQLTKILEKNDRNNDGVAQWRSPPNKKFFWVNKDANDVEVGYLTRNHDIHTTWLLTFTLPVGYTRPLLMKGQKPETMEKYLLIDPVKFPQDGCNRQLELGWRESTIPPYVYSVTVQKYRPMCGDKPCTKW